MPNRIMRLGLLTFGQVWALNQAHTIIPVYGRHHTWKCHAKSVRRHFFYVLIVRKVSHRYCNDVIGLDHSSSKPFNFVLNKQWCRNCAFHVNDSSYDYVIM